ncbi:hypothetical protein EMGBS15_15110 [Filimonas sp.]|nr:hypothetical protein EMGBS15_15110 [Filimonas sp.]
MVDKEDWMIVNRGPAVKFVGYDSNRSQNKNY